jgi:hypothetical protein
VVQCTSLFGKTVDAKHHWLDLEMILTFLLLAQVYAMYLITLSLQLAPVRRLCISVCYPLGFICDLMVWSVRYAGVGKEQWLGDGGCFKLVCIMIVLNIGMSMLLVPCQADGLMLGALNMCKTRSGIWA